MGNLGKDAKDLLIGKDGSEKEPDDFKPELQNAIKNGIITKADGTLLITAREASDKLGSSIDKKQADGVRKINDKELYDSAEEELEAMKKKEEKKKEQERKRKEREAEVARQQTDASKVKMKNDAAEKSKAQKERE